jgi:DnaJ-domain-containing protein 1
MQPTFDVDSDALDVAFKNLQRRVHPDSFYSKSRIEAEYALQVSSCPAHFAVLLSSTGAPAD